MRDTVRFVKRHLGPAFASLAVNDSALNRFVLACHLVATAGAADLLEEHLPARHGEDRQASTFGVLVLGLLAPMLGLSCEITAFKDALEQLRPVAQAALGLRHATGGRDARALERADQAHLARGKDPEQAPSAALLRTRSVSLDAIRNKVDDIAEVLETSPSFANGRRRRRAVTHAKRRKHPTAEDGVYESITAPELERNESLARDLRTSLLTASWSGELQDGIIALDGTFVPAFIADGTSAASIAASFDPDCA